MDADGSKEALGSETKDLITSSTAGSMSISISVSVALAPRSTEATVYMGQARSGFVLTIQCFYKSVLVFKVTSYINAEK